MSDIERFLEGRGRLGALLRALPTFEPPPGMEQRFRARLTALARPADGAFEPPAGLATAVLGEAARLDAAQAARRQASLRALSEHGAETAFGAPLTAATRRWLATRSDGQVQATARPRRPAWFGALSAGVAATLALGVALQLMREAPPPDERPAAPVAAAPVAVAPAAAPSADAKRSAAAPMPGTAPPPMAAAEQARNEPPRRSAALPIGDAAHPGHPPPVAAAIPPPAGATPAAPPQPLPAPPESVAAAPAGPLAESAAPDAARLRAPAPAAKAAAATAPEATSLEARRESDATRRNLAGDATVPREIFPLQQPAAQVAARMLQTSMPAGWRVRASAADQAQAQRWVDEFREALLRHNAKVPVELLLDGRHPGRLELEAITEAPRGQ